MAYPPLENGQEILSLFIPMVPVAKARPKICRAGWAYTPAKTKNAEKELKTIVKISVPYEWAPYPDALSVCITIQIPKPKSARKRVYPTCRPDIDNFIKLVLDGCNELLWVDDSQVVELWAMKVYAADPGIQITLKTPSLTVIA